MSQLRNINATIWDKVNTPLAVSVHLYAMSNIWNVFSESNYYS